MLLLPDTFSVFSAAQVRIQQHWQLRWAGWRPDYTEHSKG